MILPKKMKKQDEPTGTPAPARPMDYDTLMAEAGEAAAAANERADAIAAEHAAEVQRIEALRKGLAALQRQEEAAQEAHDAAADDHAVAVALEAGGVEMDAPSKKVRFDEAATKLGEIRGRVATAEAAIAAATARAQDLFTKEQEARRAAKQAPKLVADRRREELLARFDLIVAALLDLAADCGKHNASSARKTALGHAPLSAAGTPITFRDLSIDTSPSSMIGTWLACEGAATHLERQLRDRAAELRQAAQERLGE